MRLYIIRHGETAWNTQLRLQGQTDIELNENGRLLAKKTAQAMRGIPFDLVLTSPLSRAKETALLVLDGRNIPVIEDTRIREISFGDMEGERISKEEREDPNSRFYRFFHDPGHYIAAAHGESIQSLCERTADFLAELKEKKEWQDKTILISTPVSYTHLMPQTNDGEEASPDASQMIRVLIKSQDFASDFHDKVDVYKRQPQMSLYRSRRRQKYEKGRVFTEFKISADRFSR